MRIPWGLIVGAAALVVVGFFAGRASVRVDDQDLRDSLAVYRSHRKDDAAENARMRNALADEHAARVRSEAATLSLTESAARLVAGASRTMVTANETRRRADSILASLRNARTAGDSIAILANACTERGNECALVRRANDSLFRATDSLRIAGDSSSRTIASFRRDSVTYVKRIARDSTRLAEADGLVTRLERNARGCRVPLVGFPCPTAIANYDLTSKAISFGGGFPIKRWLTVSVTTQVGKP